MLQIIEDLSSNDVPKGSVLQNHRITESKYIITPWAFHPENGSSRFMGILSSEMSS